MTNDQINTAIAEACGWMHQNISRNAVYYIPADFFVGNPTTDLNAMHEAENTLDIHTSNRMTGWLLMLLGEENQASIYSFTAVRRATARQRAEAFLRTIGKWEEVQP